MYYNGLQTNGFISCWYCKSQSKYQQVFVTQMFQKLFFKKMFFQKIFV